MKDPAPQLLVDTEGACAALGGISRSQLWRIVCSGRLPVVRLPGRRDKRSSRGTTEGTRRVLYAVDDLQKLISESREQAPATMTTVRSLKKRGAA